MATRTPQARTRGTRAPRTGRARAAIAARVLLVGYLLVPVLLTLGPTPLEEQRLLRRALTRAAGVLTEGRAEVSVREAEALGNIALFVPLGLLLALALPTVYLSVLLAVACGASLGIEVTQFVALPDRVPALLDIAMNTAGAAAGLVLGGDVRRLLRARGPTR